MQEALLNSDFLYSPEALLTLLWAHILEVSRLLFTQEGLVIVLWVVFVIIEMFLVTQLLQTMNMAQYNKRLPIPSVAPLFQGSFALCLVRYMNLVS